MCAVGLGPPGWCRLDMPVTAIPRPFASLWRRRKVPLSASVLGSGDGKKGCAREGMGRVWLLALDGGACVVRRSGSQSARIRSSSVAVWALNCSPPCQANALARRVRCAIDVSLVSRGGFQVTAAHRLAIDRVPVSSAAGAAALAARIVT